MFGVLVAALTLVTLGAIAVFTGAIPSPLDRGFTTAAPDTGSKYPPAPCPPGGTLAVAYGGVQVTVLNATRRAGLATETASALSSRGFVILATKNSPAAVAKTAEIRFGPAGLAAAYTLAGQFKDPTLVLDTRPDASVDLAVGQAFTAPLEASKTTAPGTALTGVDGCVPLANAVPVPAAASATPAAG